ncbi:MAG: Holliday junction branch migration protein RuvA [Butyricicoccus sp.]|nr:Holliday junction branch migration protein RuvA [Butyricicoccus sp.]
MFYYIDGKVAYLEQSLCVIDAGGVGYEIHTSQNTISKLKMGERARIYTYLYLREEICDLYGFSDLEEKKCFLQLISVSGVGPKAALAILSVAPPSRLALAIITGDEKMLTQAPGIGKKIAQRIVLELRDKMSKGQLEAASPSASAVLEMPGKDGAVNHTQEAIAALMVLGYSQAEALHALEGLDGLESAETEDIIRACLKRLALQ